MWQDCKWFPLMNCVQSILHGISAWINFLKISSWRQWITCVISVCICKRATRDDSGSWEVKRFCLYWKNIRNFSNQNRLKLETLKIWHFHYNCTGLSWNLPENWPPARILLYNAKPIKILISNFIWDSDKGGGIGSKIHTHTELRY